MEETNGDPITPHEIDTLQTPDTLAAPHIPRESDTPQDLDTSVDQQLDNCDIQGNVGSPIEAPERPNSPHLAQPSTKDESSEDTIDPTHLAPLSPSHSLKTQPSLSMTIYEASLMGATVATPTFSQNSAASSSAQPKRVKFDLPPEKEQDDATTTPAAPTTTPPGAGPAENDKKPLVPKPITNPYKRYVKPIPPGPKYRAIVQNPLHFLKENPIKKPYFAPKLSYFKTHNIPISSPDDLAILQRYSNFRKHQRNRLLRGLGVQVPLEPFEPGYVRKGVCPEEPYWPHLIFFALFVCWYAAVGWWIKYRIWALRIAYDPYWHGANIHQDLRYDKSMWALYRHSLPVLVVLYGFTTFWTTFKGARYWRDLFCMICLRGYQYIGILRRRILHRKQTQPDAEIEKAREHGIEENDWDFDWEAKKVTQLRFKLWWVFMALFQTCPLVITILYARAEAMKVKCTQHDENDPWNTFGYTINKPWSKIW